MLPSTTYLFFNAQMEVQFTMSVASALEEPKQKEISSSPAAPLLLTMAQMNEQLKLHSANEKQPDICRVQRRQRGTVFENLGKKKSDGSGIDCVYPNLYPQSIQYVFVLRGFNAHIHVTKPATLLIWLGVYSAFTLHQSFYVRLEFLRFHLLWTGAKHVITANNCNNNSISWKHKGGKLFISTLQHKHIKKCLDVALRQANTLCKKLRSN